MTETDTKKRNMIEALKSTFGIVSQACDKVDIARQTHYTWLKEDADYREAVHDIEEMTLDFGESQLLKKMRGFKTDDGTIIAPSDTAIIFFLKTKGKKRGYVERVEHDTTISLSAPVEAKIQLSNGTTIDVD